VAIPLSLFFERPQILNTSLTIRQLTTPIGAAHPFPVVAHLFSGEKEHIDAAKGNTLFLSGT
jgi:hypothetical protein